MVTDRNMKVKICDAPAAWKIGWTEVTDVFFSFFLVYAELEHSTAVPFWWLNYYKMLTLNFITLRI